MWPYIVIFPQLNASKLLTPIPYHKHSLKVLETKYTIFKLDFFGRYLKCGFSNIEFDVEFSDKTKCYKVNVLIKTFRSSLSCRDAFHPWPVCALDPIFWLQTWVMFHDRLRTNLSLNNIVQYKDKLGFLFVAFLF